MATARDVANYFLMLAAGGKEDAGEAMTHLKLQKLLYYAQGFNLAIHDRPLFSGLIEAWDHGPVVNSLWSLYQKHGSNPIPPEAAFDAEKALTPEERELLTDVWNAYGQFSAWRLRDMTHKEPPWRDAYKKGENATITHDALKRYFRTQLE